MAQLENMTVTKDSYSTANESKQQFNRFIIYCLNIVPMVNDSLRKKKNVKMSAAEARSRAV